MNPDSRVVFDLWHRRDWCNQDIAGVEHHKSEFEALLPKLGENSTEIETVARIIPEPTNRFDRNAVQVVVQGLLIGYLPREIAPGYQQMLLRLGANGFVAQVPVALSAHAYNSYVGVDRRGNEITRREIWCNARVALEEPHLCVPGNLPPSTPYALLPTGNALQAKGEDQHMDVLTKYLRPEGEQWVYATMHVVERSTARTSKQIVELAVDGDVVGELTPAMSAEFAPIVEKLAECGKLCAIQAIVKGNPLKADVTLHAAKAGTLDVAWLRENLVAVAPALSSRNSAPTAIEDQDGSPAVDSATPLATSSSASAHVPIPPKPTRIVFQAPPGWPTPPEGWEPFPGWEPGPELPSAPEGWQYWRMR